MSGASHVHENDVKLDCSAHLIRSSRLPRAQQVLHLLPKKATHVAKNFRSYKKCSQLSVDIFIASGDLLVAQKSLFFLQKISK